MQSSADDVLLQQALDATRAELERPSTSEHAKAWLPAYLGSGEGMRQLYGLLAQHCSRDAFLAQLARARGMVARPGDAADGVTEPHDANNTIGGEVHSHHCNIHQQPCRHGAHAASGATDRAKPSILLKTADRFRHRSWRSS